MKTSCRSIGVQPLNVWYLAAPRLFALLSAILFPLAALQAQMNYATPYTFTTFAGSAASGDADGTGRAARFRAPAAAAVDTEGNVYIADCLSNTIRKITASGVVTTFAGSAGLRGSTDGVGSAARFAYPSGVAVDSAGNVYVADCDNSTIRKITSGGLVTTFAGSEGANGSADGTATAARFSYPRSVAVDDLGNVYVADTSNHAIRKITPAGIVSTFAGSAGVAGSVDATGSAARFNTPYGVAVDNSDNVYVADSYNHTIRKITPARVVTTLAGLAESPGTTDGTGSGARLWYPFGVAVDGSGNVYVGGASRLRRISAAGVVTTYSDVAGNKGWTADTGDPVFFNAPEGVAVDSAGSVYVAERSNYSIRKISADGATLTTLAGIANSAGYVDGTGSAAQFNLPIGVAVDGAGNLYVADLNNSTIRKISSAGVTTTLAGAAGSPGFTNGTGTVARFDGPFGVAADGVGNVYVADTNNQAIRKITPAGGVTTLATLASFPLGIAVDGAGNLYTTDAANTVSKISASGVVTLLAGFANNSGANDGTGTTARFNQPQGIAVDGAGNLFIADTQNFTIRKVTPSGVVTTIAGLAGESSLIDGTGSNARFGSPIGVAVDAVGNVFVTDGGLETIRRITPAGVVTSLAGGNWGARDGTGLAAQFAGPRGIAVDNSGTLWVTESVNNTIRRGVLAPPILTSAVSGSGALRQSFNYAAVFSGGPTSYSANGLPTGLNCDAATGVIAGAPTVGGSFAVTLGATNSAGLGTATYMLTVAKGDQTVSFGTLADKTFGASPFTVSATTDSNLSPTFSIVSGPATVSGNTITLTGAGIVVVRASQGGDSNYNAAPDVERSFTVSKALATVTLGRLSNTYDGSAHAATATTNPASLTVNFTYDGSSIAPTNAGSYNVVGTINAPNYVGSASGTLEIAKASASVILGSLNPTYNSSAHAAIATTNPAPLTVNFTYNGSVTAPTNAGSYAVVGTISDPNYQGSASGTLNVSKATPVISWDYLVPLVYGTPLGGAQLDATANTEGTFAYSPVGGTILNAGTQDLGTTFTPTDNANYTTTTKSANLTVYKAPLIVTANGTSRAYGAANPIFGVTVWGFVNGDTASIMTGAPEFTTSATKESNVGLYQIYPTIGTLAANNNYVLSLFMQGTLSITPAPLTVTADDKTKPLGTPNPQLTISYTGFVNGDSAASLASPPTVSTNAATDSPAGPYPIFLTGGSAANYSLTYVAGTLTVNPAGFPIFTVQPLNQAVAPGHSVTFSAAATGTPPPSYQWKRGGLNINGATGNTYTIASVTMGDIGSYSVVATNSVGTATSDSVVLSVIIAPSNAVISISVE